MPESPRINIITKADGGPAFLTVTIASKPAIGAEWAYEYRVEPGPPIMAKSILGHKPKMEYPLGTPASLHLDLHAWSIRFANLGLGKDDEVEVSAKLVWKQEQDGKRVTIAESEKYSGTLTADNAVEVFVGDAIFINAAD